MPLGGAPAAQERDRGRILDRYKWKLEDIFPSEEAWRHAKEQLVPRSPESACIAARSARRRRGSPMRWSWSRG